MSDFPYEVENFVPENDPDFEAPPADSRWGGSGPTDENAEVIEDAH